MSQPLTHAGGEHRGVLARAVHQRSATARRRRGSPPRGPRRRAGSPAGVCSAASSRPGRGEDPAYAVDVEGLARVRRAGQREQLGRQVEAERGPCPAPGAACCTSAAASARRRRRPTTPTVPSGVERDDGAVVVPLHEPGADDLGDDDRRRTWRAGSRPGRSELSRMTPVPTPPVPQHCPTPRELDDLELLTSGALAPVTRRSTSPGSPVTLDLPPSRRAAARPARSSWSTPRACRWPGSAARRRGRAAAPTRSSAPSAGST